MGQKISTIPVDKFAQESAKWNLYLFTLKLIKPEEHAWYMNNYFANYN